MITPDDRFSVHGRTMASKPHLVKQYKSNLTQKECWAFCDELREQGYTRIEVRKQNKK
jgi:hypothetical protein